VKILLLGNTGQLGWELERALATVGEEVHAIDFPELNLVDVQGTARLIRELRPKVIVNATAYTAVDKAEQERELAEAINARGPGLLAEEARSLGAALIHYSTDYVFDGAKGEPYVETDEPCPLGAYGESKLAGEKAVGAVGCSYLIFRTSWVYSLRRDSFVTKVLQWARQHRSLKLVTDQVSNPTWCRMLAEASSQILAMAANDPAGWIGERKGLYHLAGWGYASRMEWGREILLLDRYKAEQVVEEVLPALTAEFPTPAARPYYSALNCDRFLNTFGLRLPDWRLALKLAMDSTGTV
jgi:dTDP-4-dehydrorhamnose reductase